MLTGLKMSSFARKYIFYRPEPSVNGGAHEIDF